MAADYSENSELIRRVQEGSRQAMDELVQSNMGLVRSIVRRFRDRGCDYEDLMQIGVIGMMKAAHSFDFSFGTAFSTYAVPLIIGEIRRFLRDDGAVKVSRTLKSEGMTVMRRREEFLLEYGREPRIGELAERCGMEREEVVRAIEAASPVTSLNEPVSDDGMTLEGILADEENAIDKLTDRLALHEAIARLPKQQRQILVLRYVRELSQQQTGDLLGLSQVKISREEKKILTSLRQSLKAE